MIRSVEVWSDRLLARFVPRTTARAASSWRVCCNTTCTVSKVCWGCGINICCSPCVHD